MKITIQQYEEDPTTTALEYNEVNSTTTSANEEEASRLLRSEFTIDVVDNKDNKNSNSTVLPPRKVIQLNNKSTSTADSKTNSSTIIETNLLLITSTWHSLRRIFIRLFLPIGYPHSVDSTYLKYQLYDGLQGLCSYWRGVVSTKAVLEATGVGNSEATALGAALNWALRDGTGMIGGLLFSYFVSDKFDVFVKEFRLFADIINDVALTLDMIAPYFNSSQSLWILSASTLCKTMCGMSAGATKGRITQHFARSNGNMADLTAKESTQETLVSLLGMIGGIYVAKALENSPMIITWIIFASLTYIHVWANYKGVLQLKLATLNPERTQRLFDNIINVIVSSNTTTTTTTASSSSSDATSSSEALELAVNEFPTPEGIHESLLSSTLHLLFPTIHVATTPILDIQKLEYLQEFQNQNYVLGCSSTTTNRRCHIYIWLRLGASYKDELQAYVHALVIQKCILASSASGDCKWDAQLINRTMNDLQPLFDDDDTATTTKTKSSILKGKTIIELLEEEKGWDITQNRLYLGFSPSRIQWTIKDE